MEGKMILTTVDKTILSKGILPITMSSFIRKLEINEKYYEHYSLI